MGAQELLIWGLEATAVSAGLGFVAAAVAAGAYWALSALVIRYYRSGGDT